MFITSIFLINYTLLMLKYWVFTKTDVSQMIKSGVSLTTG